MISEFSIYLLLFVKLLLIYSAEGSKYCPITDISKSEAICGKLETCEQLNSTTGICQCLANYERSGTECIPKSNTPSNNPAAITSDTDKPEESGSILATIIPVTLIAILVLGVVGLAVVGKRRWWDRIPHLQFGRRSSDLTRSGNLSQLECSDDDVPPYYASALGGGSHPYRGASLTVSDVPYSSGGFGGNDIPIVSSGRRKHTPASDDDDDPPVC